MNSDLPTLVTEDWLHLCPVGILIEGAGGRAWGNPALARLLHTAPEDLNPSRWPELQQAEGLVRVRVATGEARWLSGQRVQVTGHNGQELHLCLFRDATAEVQSAGEREELERKVQELTLTDTLTGLANRRALGQALAVQVSRSRRYRNPLTLALIRVGLDGGQSALPEPILAGVGRFLRERLRWVDLIGREEEDCFMLIMPETDEANAQFLMEKIREEADQLEFPPPHERVPLRLAIGVAQWRQGLDGAHLVAAVKRALEADRGLAVATG